MQRAIDLRGAVAINVITMIGIGPLVTIPLVLAALGGPLALVGWIAGAIVALCDGMVWAELSSRLPGSGGTYVYLRAAFGEQRLGRVLAFLFNWQFLLSAPCLLASGYIGLRNYAAYLFPAIDTNPWIHHGVAVGVGLLAIVLLYRRTARVAALGFALAVAATLTLAVVIVASLTHANFAQAFHLDGPIRLSAGLLAGFGSALVVTLYDYVGYADVALLGDEVVRPNRTIPLAILLSVLIVAILYVLLQVGVLGVVPWHSLLDASGNPTPQAQYVASYVVAHVWGFGAAAVVTGLVLVTAFASVYGNLLGFSRIPFAAARDGAFLRAFARVDEKRQIPHVALLVVGGLSILASFFSLDQTIQWLTAGIALIQGMGQVLALALLRRTGRAPFAMPLYPLPAFVALAGWCVAFSSTGSTAIVLGCAWLLAGTLVYAVAARVERWWPFAAGTLALALAVTLPVQARAGPLPQWQAWHASQLTTERGYPVFAVDGRPFFIYGAAFFYERIPRDRWRDAMHAYKTLGINTLDLYAIWNWHEPAEGPPDFTGRTDPRRDFAGVLALAHEFGFKIVLRPGPVIRNEWRNGGYPAWLLQRPEYNMPLHDVLEGRYPATATLQNAHADAAASEWLANATHLQASSQWLRDVFTAAAPFTNDVIAVALDDDQGAYIDNDTWPAPHWHAYVDWLRLTVQSVAGDRIPLFINTFESKVTAAAPAWAWGDWYQSDAYSIGAHDLSQLDFATGLLQTQPHLPVMQAEFQAGWLQGADEGRPRAADPSNTALALNELLRDGAHGVVNFPVQDTIYPDGWEAPWANWSYAWDAALTVDLGAAPRYAPTAAFADAVARYGPLLARTHPAADAAIVWPVSMFSANAVTNADVAAFADATIAMQRRCAARRLTCDLVDLAYADDRTLARYARVILPAPAPEHLRASMGPPVARRLERLRRSGVLADDIPAGLQSPYLSGADDATLLLANDGSYGFVDVVNPSTQPRRIGPMRATLARTTVEVPAFTLDPRAARLIPIGIAPRAMPPVPQPLATPPPFSDADGAVLEGTHLRVVYAPNAGARIAELGTAALGNAASSIGLLRDAVEPAPPASARDFIAPYTHPLPAGTFNRPYACTLRARDATPAVTCTYAAPDVPAGGATFTRTLQLAPDGDAMVVHERFDPAAPSPSAKLASVSGFAFGEGDELIHPAGSPALGILHGHRLATLRWRTAEVASIDVRATRGAQIVTLVFAGASAELRLGVVRAADPAEARRLVQANPG